MSVDVRTVTAEEFPGWVAALKAGFLLQHDEGEAEHRLVGVDLDRVWGAFDGERIVGTLRSWACELTVPGGAFVNTAALTNVTVSPTHRRRGLLTRMLEPDLRAAAEREEAAGILIAAEYPIYGRFGYGPAVDRLSLAVDARAARFLEPSSGSVELADLATLAELGPELYERSRREQPGAITRTPRWWETWCEVAPYPGDDPFKGFVAIGRDEQGTPDGYVRYRADNSWSEFRPDVTLTIEELLALTPAAYQRLWRFCCEFDWVGTVKADDRSVDELLPWLVADGRVVVESLHADFVWVRPFDVPALLSARTYLAEGRVVLDVVDALGLATGRFVLEGGPDGATCKPTDESAHLTVPVDTLGAASLGSRSLRQLDAAGRLDVHDASALAVADSMFRGDVTPWCSTWF
jgi:predicted acetyltransferase